MSSKSHAWQHADDAITDVMRCVSACSHTPPAGAIKVHVDVVDLVVTDTLENGRRIVYDAQSKTVSAEDA